MAGRAIVYRDRQTMGVELRDISHKGVGLVSPLQVFPQEQLVLQLHKELRLLVVLRRCRRLGEGRYSCGVNFAPDALDVRQFREIQQLLS